MNGGAQLPVRSDTSPSLMAHGHATAGRLSSFQAEVAAAVGSGSSYSKSMTGAGGSGTATTLLTIFTASVIGLIIYTMAKMFSARLLPPGDGYQGGMNCFSSLATAAAAAKDVQQTSSADFYFKNSTTGTSRCSDLRKQRRQLLKISREERIRRLISHHGGRSVSQAIRYLASELREQKLYILKSLIERATNDADPTECACSCHDGHDGDEQVTSGQRQDRRRSTSDADLN